ncbi:MAG TPA: hypothetical protein VJ959_11945 [Desulfotignum sp.]|nr:hypothetical protein [Desulfotignum sp.]
MKQISINGIRLGRKMVQAVRYSVPGQNNPPVYQTLARHRINMVCAGLHYLDKTRVFSCCLEAEHRQTAARLLEDVSDLPDVCMVSIYPHHSSPAVPGTLLQMMGQAGIGFAHLVSSPAMVCVVIDIRDQNRVISLVESAFDLPPSHTPYFQEITEDISCFLQKYPETRAFYVEEKIKTYGIGLTPGLALHQISCTGTELADAGAHLAGMAQSGKKFYFVSAMPGPDHAYDLFLLTDPGAGTTSTMTADFISFHGPHFGDRYKILGTAMDCLGAGGVPVILVGCTGASISLVVPEGRGQDAGNALASGFEAP